MVRRAFKTGDQGRLEEDMLFFNGRNDDLIKLHGYRIELNEITSVLNDLDYVHHGEALALKRNGAVKKIVAVVRLQPDSEASKAQLSADLGKRIPSYMIPSDIKFVVRNSAESEWKSGQKAID